MSSFEVDQPILNSPYYEPAEHWYIEEGRQAERRAGRRRAGYFYRDPKAPASDDAQEARSQWLELTLVNQIREQVKAWRILALRGEGGVTRTTQELLNYWRRDGRLHRLFFAQIEAVETIIFLKEARGDFLQGIDIPVDDVSQERKADGFSAFQRYACKMATGAGKTTVMGMVAAWSILNKINDRMNAVYSDVILIVCPNVTIRNRLQELDPSRGDASLYRTRDLVPQDLMPDLAKGRVLMTNWHIFEPQGVKTGGTGAKVNKAGIPIRVKETITISNETKTARGKRYLTLKDFQRQLGAGMLTLLKEDKDKQGNLIKVLVESLKYIESDTSMINL